VPTVGDDFNEALPTMKKLLTLEQVHFRYQKKLLQGVHLELFAGERLTLLGFNGAGKTTLLKLIAGQLPWQRGRIFWQGQALAPWRLRTGSWRQRIGFAPQSLSNISVWSVVDYLDYAAALLQLSSRRQRVKALLKTFDLLSVAKTPCSQLSTGTFKRLLLAQAFLTDPLLLLLDEPTAGLDVHQRQQFFDLLKNIDSAIILTTHHLHEATLLRQRSIFLRQGQVVTLQDFDFSLPYYRVAWHKPPSLADVQILLTDLPASLWQGINLSKPCILPLHAKNLSLIQRFAEAWGLWLLTPLTLEDAALHDWINKQVGK
jgi:ABC-2 type transport system ATP-binding protein